MVLIIWHYQLNGHEFEQTPGDSERQGSQHIVDHGVTTSGTLHND